MGQIYDNALRGLSIKVPNDNVLEAIMKNPDVDYVHPDVKVKAFAQNLPTGVNRVDGDLSSTKSGDGSGAVNVDIGIMDTGIDLNHADPNVYRQVTFVSGTSSGNDDNGHGTAVAGVAAAKDNSQGVVGLAPGARLWAIKVLDSNGIPSSSNIIKGIDYVTQLVFTYTLILKIVITLPKKIVGMKRSLTMQNLLAITRIEKIS